MKKQKIGQILARKLRGLVDGETLATIRDTFDRIEDVVDQVNDRIDPDNADEERRVVASRAEAQALEARIVELEEVVERHTRQIGRLRAMRPAGVRPGLRAGAATDDDVEDALDAAEPLPPEPDDVEAALDEDSAGTAASLAG